jgi:8-oxo-dGTP diphosphatase
MLRLAGCVILDEQGRIGLLHRNTEAVTQWELPGGKVEVGESDETAALRELQEELGINVRIERKLGSTDFTFRDVEYVYVWFLAEISNGTPRVMEPQTFDDYSYFAIKQLSSLELSANMQKLMPLLSTDL